MAAASVNFDVPDYDVKALLNEQRKEGVMCDVTLEVANKSFPACTQVCTDCSLTLLQGHVWR